MKKTMIAVLVGALLVSCSTAPQKAVESANKQTLPNFNYVVEGGEKWGLVQAFELNGKTYVQFLDLDRANPVFIGGDGEEIHYGRNGMYAVFDKPVTSFVVVSTFGRATVHTRTAAPLPLAAVPPTLPPADVEADVNVHAIDPMTSSVLQSALDLSARQLEELKSAEALNVGDPTVSRKLDLIEKRLALLNEAIESGNLPVLHVYFDDNSTAFIPDADLSALLVSAAGEAEKVLVRGFTDSNSLTSAARKLAVLRAQSAKKFLLDNGIDKAKVRTSFVSAGGHVALNTPAGRPFNRRVDIVLKFSDSDLKEASALQVWNGKAYK